MKFQRVLLVSMLIAGASVLDACMPYTVASTARTARQDQTQVTVSSFAVRNSYKLQSANDSSLTIGVDVEARRGISPRSDVGLRLTSASGAMLSYKRRLDGASDKAGPGIAVQVGGGFLNYAQYAAAEGTLIVSGGEEGRFTPYGGLRGVYTAPFLDGAVKDDPVYGGFLGFRWGTSQLGLSTELGVFRERIKSDQAAFYRPDLIKNRLAIIPSISLHADFLGWLDRFRNRNRRD